MASLSDILPYAKHFASLTGIRQVIYHNPRTNDYGRVPLPEWNLKYSNSRCVGIAKLVKPGE